MSLIAGRTYTWDQLGHEFFFKPDYFKIGGGMLSSTARDAVLLITHPNGGQSFDYQDQWDGRDLLYTGKGQVGDQKVERENRKVADNSADLFLFEAAGRRTLKFLGKVKCVDTYWSTGPDKFDIDRRVLKFRLRFLEG